MREGKGAGREGGKGGRHGLVEIRKGERGVEVARQRFMVLVF